MADVQEHTGGGNKRGTREDWGAIRKTTSGRWQARYLHEGVTYTARTAADKPLTFDTRGDARQYLAEQRAAIRKGEWQPPGQPKAAPVLFGDYALRWLATRRGPKGRELAERTREHYTQLLRDHLVPTFGRLPVTAITPEDVDKWFAGLDPGRPTARAHAYGLLRTIMFSAVSRDVIDKSPCRIKGAGQVERAREIRPASLDELEDVVNALPDRYQVMALMAAWCALRFGELAELRRSDVEIREVDGVRHGTVRVSRGVVRTKAAGRVVKDPKSQAGKRVVAIPPHLIPAIEDHLDEYAIPTGGLLFPAAGDPAKHLAHSALNKVWVTARAKAGRPDLAFHDLRHTGATLAAATGATLAELMARLGHSTTAAAMRYQHASQDRDRVIADALSALVGQTKRES